MTDMKRFTVLFLAVCAVFILCSCSKASVLNEKESGKKVTTASSRPGFEDVTAPPADDITTETVSIDKAAEKREAAMDATKAFLGENDPETGMKFVFSYDGEESLDGEIYDKIRVSVRSVDGVMTSYGYYLVSADGTVSEYGN